MQSGDSLSHFTILDKIGQGGMGEVFRALDTKLDREVAIKVLPEAFAEDPDRLSRFQREAKLLASLNHPNVASVFGVHRFEDTRFLAMELVQGEDLSERLRRGRLPVDEALDIARQIAEALEAAHDSGVIHRDLKPANIKMTASGAVKILDFGLAKGLGPSGASAEMDLTQLPTATSAGTVAGAILGTAPYMSPEQARGQAVDTRTDIWSFGCVVLECLTGKSLFGRETGSDSIGAVLQTDPDWTQLPPNTPQAVRRLLRRCLAKDKDKRLHHIADARIELEDSEPSPPAAGSSSRGYKIAVAALAIALAASLTALLLSFLQPATHRTE